MYNLRSLEEKDVDGMLEWMHDPASKKLFRYPFDTQTREKVQNFIEENKGAFAWIRSGSISPEMKNLHFAVEDENGEYMGTISLKNIDLDAGNAEYAISMRACAQGTGAAKRATELVLQIAFLDLKLEKVYLNVLEDNLRAIGFYKKAGFVFEGKARNHVRMGAAYKTLEWYSILKGEFLNKGRGGN